MAFGSSFLVGRGLIKADDLSPLVGVMLTAVGAVMTASSAAWSIWRNTHASTIAAAAALPKVQTIITTDQKTADAAPSTKVVGPANLSPTN
jgi:hypothetical protein